MSHLGEDQAEIVEEFSGKSVRGYQIQERIGEGGFGIVYRAHQPIVKRDVVIKAILPVYANNPDFIRSFEAEAQLIARLEHLHIVPLYDYWRDPEGAFLVMRWLRGGSLMPVLNKPWPLDMALKTIDQIASGLAAAHQKNIIHQDIKPANILLDEEGNAYLTDFGLAKDLEKGVDLSESTVSTSVRGSPAYISPEQIKRSTITPKTDIYSLGIVIYEMLCGQQPFGAGSVIELLRHQLSTQLPDLQKIRPELPDKLNIVLWKATAKDPDVRYASIVEMMEALHTVVDDMYDAQADPDTAGNVSSPPPTITRIIDLDAIDLLLAGPLNPYKGLRAFQEADASDFFGRESLVDSILSRFTDTDNAGKFVAVVGPSGSGKSSVIRAGVIPAIRSGRVPHWKQWFITDMTPGTNPLEELKNALLKVASKPVENLTDQLSNSSSLTQTLQNILPNHDTGVILFVDQFEELFTLTTDEHTRSHFLTMLYETLNDPNSRLRLIIALRADFYDRPLLYAGFGELIRKHTEVVLPLSSAELEAAIVRPAQQAGLSLEEGLVQRIIADIRDQPGALPQLQFMLTELFERREKSQLTRHAYETTGGISGALARRANQLYDQLDAQHQSVAQQIFLRLVNLTEDMDYTRRRAKQSELVSANTQEAVVQSVIDTFGASRLLTFDRDPTTREPTIELAHEALIRKWDKLHAWLEENIDNLRALQQLTAATTMWTNANRDTSFLAEGARLAQFEALPRATTLALDDTEQAYIEASIRRRTRARWRNRIFVSTLILLCLLFAFATLNATIQRNEAERAREAAAYSEATAIAEQSRADHAAQIARSRELAASALMVADKVDLSLLLALESFNTADTFQARNSLLTLLQNVPRLNTILSGPTDWIRDVAYSPHGDQIASASRDGSIHIWDTLTKQEAYPPLTGHRAWVNTVSFHPDSPYLVSGAEDGSLILWKMGQDSIESQPLTGHSDTVWSAVFSPDGDFIASAGAGGILRLWDAETGEPVATTQAHDDTIYTIAYTPDGTILATGSADNSIRLWDSQTLDPLGSLEGHTNWIFSLAFSSDGRWLASGSADNAIRVWDMQTRQPLTRPLLGHTTWVRSLQFLPQSSMLVSGGADGLILLWDAAGGTLLDGWQTPGGQTIWDIAISPDQQTVASGGTDASVYLWDLQPQPGLGQIIDQQDEQVLASTSDHQGKFMATAGGLQTDFSIHVQLQEDQSEFQILNGHTNQVTALAFHPTKPWLASGSLDQTVIIWHVETGEILHTFQIRDSVFSVTFRPDGQEIAIGDNTGTVYLWAVAESSDWQQEPTLLTGHTDRVLSLAYHPDGQLLATGSRDRSIHLLDVSTGALVDNLIGHTDGVRSVAFSPDGTLLASSSRDATIRLWSEAATGWQQSGEPLTGHENWVMDVKFSPDGTMLASASGDQSIILWDVQQRAPIGQPFVGHTDWVNTLAFNIDGSHLYSGGRDGNVIAWATSLRAWKNRACQIANRNLRSDEQRQYFTDQPPTPLTTCPVLKGS
ncbi:MAG: hypothetical protein CL610_09005 [Anaerolineaceae bacterium]|nr:hypothetical protein [Anaerolineaceae bacterium]